VGSNAAGAEYAFGIPATAQHLSWPEEKVQAAFKYAKAFPQEITEAIAENDSVDFASLKRKLPQTTSFSASKAGKH